MMGMMNLFFLAGASSSELEYATSAPAVDFMREQ